MESYILSKTLIIGETFLYHVIRGLIFYIYIVKATNSCKMICLPGGTSPVTWHLVIF